MATYIGNVAGSSSSDTQKVNQLFGDKLSITVDNVPVNVTLLIKREDVDGNTQTGDSYSIGSGSNAISAQGCEMTLYMTTDPLTSSGSRATVYAAVFTCDVTDGANGTWYMLGDMYTGTAPVLSYEGDNRGTGSFHTDSWLSSKDTYSVITNYSYSVAANATIKDIVMTKDQTAINTMQSLLNSANNILRNGQYAGDAIVKLQESFNKASRCYTVNSDGSVTVNSNSTRAQLIPLIKELDTRLKSFSGLL